MGVLAKYLALRMKKDKPNLWSIDDFEGMEPWEEEKQEPPASYKQDAETSVNQYHKMMHEL